MDKKSNKRHTSLTWEKPSNEVNNPPTTSTNYPIYEKGYESTTPKGTRVWYDSLDYIGSNSQRELRNSLMS